MYTKTNHQFFYVGREHHGLLLLNYKKNLINILNFMIPKSEFNLCFNLTSFGS